MSTSKHPNSASIGISRILSSTLNAIGEMLIKYHENVRTLILGMMKHLKDATRDFAHSDYGLNK